ncbi:MAG: erythromycin esterase family protein [Gammaproteobacteria bacterium]|nr:erythromycin esterase family protein [Gammaproteobacteria bacterium]
MNSALRTPFIAVRELARRLDEAPRDYDRLLDLAGDRNFVLLGEATHGTHEFYRMRADITRRLLSELDFDAVAIEGDWPDAWRVNRFVGGDADGEAATALGDFERFPQWLWRNREVLDFIGWLRGFNTRLPAERKVGFYGLDLYSLYRSAEQVIGYLQSVDPEQAQIARRRYTALDHVRDPQSYGYEAAMSLRPSAQQAVRLQLQELRERAGGYLEGGGLTALDAQFAAERNAAAVVNAEVYYRAMFGSRINTWNLRDAHMRDTLFALAEHRLQRGGSGRIIVWAHNSHLGDARATEMHRQGEWNLGQLVREAAGSAALLVGFTAYTGHVSAASRWDGPVEQKWLRPALPDSYEHLFHSTRLDRFFLPLVGPAAAPLSGAMLERAVGVIYVPHSERGSHYFSACLAAQFDAIFHLDETAAVEPLQAPGSWHERETVQTPVLSG